MRHLIGSALVLMVVLLTGVIGAVAYGRQQPALTHAQQREFAVCDGYPCFWEMIAGVTPFDEVRTKMHNFLMTEGRPGRLPFSLPQVGVRGNLYWNEQTRIVTGIGLVKRRPKMPTMLPTLLELILLYGEPCAVQPYSQSVTLIFPHIWMDFPREKQMLTFASRPETLVFENVYGDLCTTPTDNFYPRQAWQGVAAFDRYRPD